MSVARKINKVTEADWFYANSDYLTEQYPGEWVAIAGGTVVAHAPTAAGLREGIRDAGAARPFVVRLPGEPRS